MNSRKMTKFVSRSLAGLTALALILSIDAQFRDSSLKAADADQAVSASAQEVVVEMIEVSVPETAPEEISEVSTGSADNIG